MDKADALNSQAEQFQKKGNQLRRAMWWQNCRMKLIALVVVLLLAVVLFLAICFGGGNNW